MSVELVRIDALGRALDIECAWVGAGDPAAPLVVWLHEGLGSLSMWRDFPERACRAAGLRGLVWSRPGYGRSTPRPHDERWAPDFMHRQAREVLPALLRALRVEGRYHLVGHSDGGSIALLHAAAFPERVERLAVLAPHVFVEPVSVASIAATRRHYLDTAERPDGLHAKLARHHADVESAFWGWNDIWLDPRFLDWNLEAEVAAIRAPVLAIQGTDDEYGTMAQIHRIAAALRSEGQCRCLALPNCGHSPHRDRPDDVIAALAGFFTGLQE
ncbi:MAG TPA: alpha/beta hydrolase [Methylibium sp.]|uniref:alpha/beta fold hydrolase n=1 Tax=Methylibium sp. TaxID=2067992 RepID=UPI002DB5EA42|nr:alpha/beta hydrolase [Methylibium sp.]HEU4457505.1 alpha/beta hydrolase [Methylibium sp.]